MDLDDASRRVEGRVGKEHRRPPADNAAAEQVKGAAARAERQAECLRRIVQQLPPVVREQRLHLLRREHGKALAAAEAPPLGFRRREAARPRLVAADAAGPIGLHVKVQAVGEQHLVGLLRPLADALGRPELRHAPARPLLSAPSILGGEPQPSRRRPHVRDLHALAHSEAEPTPRLGRRRLILLGRHALLHLAPPHCETLCPGPPLRPMGRGLSSTRRGWRDGLARPPDVNLLRPVVVWSHQLDHRDAIETVPRGGANLTNGAAAALGAAGGTGVGGGAGAGAARSAGAGAARSAGACLRAAGCLRRPRAACRMLGPLRGALGCRPLLGRRRQAVRRGARVGCSAGVRRDERGRRRRRTAGPLQLGRPGGMRMWAGRRRRCRHRRCQRLCREERAQLGEPGVALERCAERCGTERAELAVRQSVVRDPSCRREEGPGARSGDATRGGRGCRFAVYDHLDAPVRVRRWVQQRRRGKACAAHRQPHEQVCEELFWARAGREAGCSGAARHQARLELQRLDHLAAQLQLPQLRGGEDWAGAAGGSAAKHTRRGHS